MCQYVEMECPICESPVVSSYPGMLCKSCEKSIGENSLIPDFITKQIDRIDKLEKQIAAILEAYPAAKVIE